MKRNDRDPLERYYTPGAVALAHVRWTIGQLLDRAIDPIHIEWVDPCAGGGAYPRAMTEYGLRRGRHSDVDPDADWPAMDALERDYAGQAVCTNPPLSRAFELLARAVASDAAAVSLLLPVTALEGAPARKYWLRDRAPSAVCLVGRMRFGGPAMDGRPKGTTSTQYCYALWLRDTQGGTSLSWQL